MAPIPATFRGTPNDLAIAMLQRMKILSPGGVNFIFTGDTQPTSNVGPWLKGGKQWYVWDDIIKEYAPLDISDSFTPAFAMSNSEPTTADPPVWLKTSKDATDVDPDRGSPIGWFVWDAVAEEWVGVSTIVASGPTTKRPASPDPLQQYYDTDISALIWFERSLWRTVSGQPGDVKFVVTEKLTDALTANPGWRLLGENNQAQRGRVLTGASQDPGGSPETSLPTSPGVSQRAALAVFGESETLSTGPSSTTTPPQMALWCLYKL